MIFVHLFCSSLRMVWFAYARYVCEYCNVFCDKYVSVHMSNVRITSVFHLPSSIFLLPSFTAASVPMLSESSGEHAGSPPTLLGCPVNSCRV